MNSSDLMSILVIIGGVWLLFLSLAFYWLIYHYKRLARDAKGESLKRILDKILKSEDLNKKGIEKLSQEVKRLDKEGLPYIRKVGLVRFNPFNETGGDQSFSLAFLDGNEKGIVMTVLHARQRTRIYIKPVKAGRSLYELSKEEKKAIDQAARGN